MRRMRRTDDSYLERSMRNQIIAVYPGTFDPMTLGHEDVVRRAAQLFSRIIVAVAAGHHKKAMFSLEERVEMAREVVRPYPHVTVESFDGLMPDVETVFLTPSDKYQFISSTFVREIAVLGGEVDNFVEPSVLRRLTDKVNATKAAS